MGKFKKNCGNVTHLKRDIFPRKAKEQTLVNLEHLAVIMEVIEECSGVEEGKTSNDHKKQKKKKFKKCPNQRVSENHYSSFSSSGRENNIEDSTRSLNPKSKKLKSPVILSNAGSLSHFMELGARTDLLCDTPMADPLGPDSFDNFQWVEVKQELPDDIEVCKVSITELPLKVDDFREISDVKSDDVEEINNDKTGHVKESNNDLVQTPETVPCNKSDNNFTSIGVQDKAVEAHTFFSEDNGDERFEHSLGRDESSDENSSDNESSKGRHETENIEQNPSKSKKKNRPQDCDICGKKLSSKGNLRLHKLKKHKLKVQFTCELCSLKFDFQREAVKHRNSIHRGEDGRFGCNVCSKRVLDYHTFLIHIKSHMDSCREEEGSGKVCTDCDKSFRDDESLKIHQTLVHSVDLRNKLKSQEKNFICDTCGRRFAFSCLLRDHINTHTGAKPYLCQKCGKAFSQKSTLKQHTKTHSDVRPFQCSECPQGFYSKGDFAKHQRKHTGERPYICEVCGEGFSRSTHLVIHRRTHTGERPHLCDICDRGFTKRGDVVRHRRVHTGELPYLCQVCGKAFRQSTQCANHIKSQHPDSPVPVARNPNPLLHGVHLLLS